MLQIGDLRGAQSLFHVAGMTIRNALQPGLAKVKTSLGHAQCITGMQRCRACKCVVCISLACVLASCASQMGHENVWLAPDAVPESYLECAAQDMADTRSLQVSTGTANTALVFHAQKLLSLHEADTPYHVSSYLFFGLHPQSSFALQCLHG